MKHGDRCIFTYRDELHRHDARNQVELISHNGQIVTVLHFNDRWIYVHDTQGRKFYADKAELTPVPQTQTPAGKQEELFK